MKRKFQRLKDFEIRRFFRTRIVYKRAGLKIFIKYTKESNPRFVVVVPKTFDKRATERHKIERKIREAINSIYKKLPNIDFVVMVNKEALKYDYSKLKSEISDVLLKKCKKRPNLYNKTVSKNHFARSRVSKAQAS